MRLLLPTLAAAPGLPHMLVLAAALFCLGLYAVMTQRHMLRTLMGLEAMLAAVALNFAAFAAYLHPREPQGQLLALAILVSGVIQVLLGALWALAAVRQGMVPDPQLDHQVGR